MTVPRIRGWLRRPSRWCWQRYFSVFYQVTARGIEHIPQSGPAILAPNHQSFYDGQLLTSVIDRQLFYFVVASYMRIPVMGAFLHNTGSIPLGKGTSALKAGNHVLAAGELLTVFPEGHRTRNGSLLRLHDGAARLACQNEVPLLPVTISGAFEAWPRHRWLPRWGGPLAVEIHPPLQGDPTIPDLRQRTRALTAQLQVVLERGLAQANSR